MPDISLEKLLETGTHFGHQFRRWNPKMRDYLYANKGGVYVFDLIKTRDNLVEALQALTDATREGKVILFVGTKKQAKEKVEEIAKAVGSPYVTERWLGGTLTNFNMIRQSIRNLEELERRHVNARQEGYTKKETLMMERDIEKLKRKFGGILEMSSTPDMIVIVDTHKERSAVAEANALGIPVLGIVDSNANPDGVDFVVPMNDDASKAIDYVLELFGEAIAEGKKPAVKKVAKPVKKEPSVKAKKEEKPKKSDKKAELKEKSKSEKKPGVKTKSNK